jgi:hypothetical protein
VDAIVLDEHEHVAPAVVFVLPQFLVVALQPLQLSHVLPLHSDGVVLELVPHLPIGVLQGQPVGVKRAYEVLPHYLQ